MSEAIDQSIAFRPLHIAVLTVSDSRKADNDISGDLLVSRIAETGHILQARGLVCDDAGHIRDRFAAWIDDPSIEIIISTGGTGVTGRDVSPEALDLVAEKKIPGFGELFRMLSYTSIGTSTVQSRADAGVASGTYLFVLPGSTGACKDAWDQILKFQLDIRHKPCNFAELLPRLREHEH